MKTFQLLLLVTDDFSEIPPQVFAIKENHRSIVNAISSAQEHATNINNSGDLVTAQVLAVFEDGAYLASGVKHISV